MHTILLSVMPSLSFGKDVTDPEVGVLDFVTPQKSKTKIVLQVIP